MEYDPLDYTSGNDTQYETSSFDYDWDLHLVPETLPEHVQHYLSGLEERLD